MLQRQPASKMELLNQTTSNNITEGATLRTETAQLHFPGIPPEPPSACWPTTTRLHTLSSPRCQPLTHSYFSSTACPAGPQHAKWWQSTAAFRPYAQRSRVSDGSARPRPPSAGLQLCLLEAKMYV